MKPWISQMARMRSNRFSIREICEIRGQKSSLRLGVFAHLINDTLGVRRNLVAINAAQAFAEVGPMRVARRAGAGPPLFNEWKSRSKSALSR
jgi:hypothetical protein